MKFSAGALFLSAAACFLSALPASAASQNFYTLSERWEKAAASGQTKEEAIDEGFGTALVRRGTDLTPRAPTPPSLTRGISEIDQTSVVLEQGQALVVSAPGIRKFIATEEGLVALEQLDANRLLIAGAGFGSTFVHLWDAAGRHTFEAQIVPPLYRPSDRQIRQQEAEEKSRSFRIGHSTSYDSFYSGDKYREAERISLDVDNRMTLEGDTPYGTLTGFSNLQKNRDKMIFTDAGARLRDAKIGPLHDFNASVGDRSVAPALMAFPEARIRGVELDNYLVEYQGGLSYGLASFPESGIRSLRPDLVLDQRGTEWMAFYGRQRAGILGILTPGIVGKRSISSYLGGGTVDHAFSDTFRLKTGVFAAHGQARQDELNQHGMGSRAEIKAGPYLTLRPEVSFDSEKFAQRYEANYRRGDFQLTNEWRDISKKFVTMVGAPGQQGEVGDSFEFSAVPWARTWLQGTFDVFRDRLIPNPANPDRVNVHRDLSFSMPPTDFSNLTFFYRDIDDTGRLSPTKQRSLGGQYTHAFWLWQHRYSFYGRYENRGYRSLTNSDRNYVVDQLLGGVSTDLFWGIRLTLQKEYNALREPNLDRSSRPNAMTYTLDWSRRLGESPLYLDARLRYRDEEETESSNSFMSGEDLTEISGGIRYRETEDLELFLTGRLENYRPESLTAPSPHVEMEVLTGVRGFMDTGFRWSAVGHFEGFVFKDTDGDGARAPGEPGLPGVTVRTQDGKEGTTDEQGFYEIRSVSGNKATLSLESADIPRGFSPTTPVSQEVAIEHQKARQVDFGLTPRSEVVGTIFEDVNANGRYDSGETGIGNVVLRIEGGPATRSRRNGSYSFGGVMAGDHTIAFDISSLPPGYLPTDALKKSFTLFEGLRYELNFPLRALRAVAGRVFQDADGSGRVEPEEKGAAGVRVALGDQTAETDAEGYYLFENVKSGPYELAVEPGTLPAGYRAPAPLPVRISEEPVTVSGKDIALEPAGKESGAGA